MLLINALLLKGNITKESVVSPDKNDGYEFGTWDIAHPNFFKKMIDMKSEGERKIINDTDLWITHEFTKEEQKKILNTLLSVKPKKRVYKGKKVTSYLLVDSNDDYFRLVIFEKWYKRLVEIFNSLDIIIWYGI